MGCGVATLAMLLESTYDYAQGLMDAEDLTHNWDKSGTTYYSIDEVLIKHGFFIRRLFQARSKGLWPPDPYAPLHYAQVRQQSGNAHFVVVLGNGDVLDPLKRGKFSLDKWEVQNITGIVRP